MDEKKKNTIYKVTIHESLNDYCENEIKKKPKALKMPDNIQF